MWKGEVRIEDEESLYEFFDSTSEMLITDEEKEKIRTVVDEADTVSWPMEFMFEIEDDKWSEFASRHPDEAKVMEQVLEQVDDNGDPAEA